LSHISSEALWFCPPIYINQDVPRLGFQASLPIVQQFISTVFLIRLVGGGVQQCPLGTSAIYWPIVTAPGDYDDGEFCGMKIGRGNRNTRRKPALAPLCPPQIPLEQTRA
jgi:hypothetical protein